MNKIYLYLFLILHLYLFFIYFIKKNRFLYISILIIFITLFFLKKTREHFSSDRIDMIIENSMVQKMLDKMTNKKCITRKKFNKLIDNFINISGYIPLIPFSRLILRYIILPKRKIDRIYDSIIEEKIKKGKKPKICKRDIEKMLRNIGKKFIK